MLAFANLKFIDQLSSDKEVTFVNFVDQTTGKNANLQFAATTTWGINAKVFGNKIEYSLGTDGKPDLTAANELLSKATFLNGWEHVPLIKKDRLYLKLKMDGSKFKFNSNVPFTPANNEWITKGMDVQVTADYGVYFNIATKKYGIFLTLTQIDFDSDEVKKVQDMLKQLA
jgi:cell division FtsZ-interacting protein ZapD